MKILFDQGTPVPLREALSSHTVETVYERGWSTLGNGELLALAETAAFDLFLTTDQNLRSQQNLSNRRIAILVPRQRAGRRFSSTPPMFSQQSNQSSRAVTWN